ncbi:MAG TPA: MBL fold metallo-hydrolase [Tepidisphaeraceae bacterium]|nr:MBL fold metallo-hydrolase [Tepidisphaeraceae bacterium]
MDAIELLFLGTGTSAGIPMIGCHCEVCSSPDPRDRRMRPSVVISYANTRVLIDTTPELRLQCLANDVDRIDAVVYTHAHADHVMGLDDVRRFNAIRGGPLDLWADEPTFSTLHRCFSYAFMSPSRDLKVFRPHLVHRPITGPFQIGPTTWTPIKLLHGEMPVLGFRIGNLAYCTDVSAIPEESFPLLEGLDVLVLDALQRERHTTHFSLEEALEASQRIGAKQTLFTHIAHRMAHAATNRALPDNMQLAYDGQRVTAGM